MDDAERRDQADRDRIAVAAMFATEWSRDEQVELRTDASMLPRDAEGGWSPADDSAGALAAMARLPRIGETCDRCGALAMVRAHGLAWCGHHAAEAGIPL